MGSGMLTGAMTRECLAALPENDWQRKDDRFKEPRLTQNVELVDRLRAVAERHGRAPGEVAIARTLHNPAVTAAIVGARNPGQIDGFIDAMDYRLTSEEVTEIARAVA